MRLALGVGAGAALLALSVLARSSGTAVWDDAFVAVRYADNLVRDGRLAWNPGGEATNGLTSPLSLLVVAPLRAAAPHSPALAAQASSLVGGLLALPLLVALVAAALSDAPSARGPVLLASALTAGLASPRLADHLTSGMDTAFATAWAAGLLLLQVRQERSESNAAVVTTGVAGGLSFFARPELALFALMVPAARAAGRRGAARRRALAVLGLTAVVLAGGLTLAASHLGSPLPLPFHAKGTGLYGPHIHERYSGVGLRELAAYGRTHLLLLAPIAAGLLIDARRGWRRTTAADAGMLAATIAWWAYHALFVLPVMHYSQRFYYPTLPALLYLGARGLATCLEFAPSSRPIRAAAWTLGGVAVVGIAARGASAWDSWTAAAARGALGRYELVEVGRLAGWDRHWPGLLAFAALPDDLAIATTEVGYPAAINPRKRILDLAGLNETALALGRTTPAAWIARERPDVVYLPNPDYREMTQAIEAEPAFAQGYVLQPATGDGLRLALRLDSPHLPAMRAALGAGAGEGPPPGGGRP